MSSVGFLGNPLAACFSIGAVFVVMGIGVLALIASIPTNSPYQDDTIRMFGQAFLLLGFALTLAACLLRYRKLINRRHQDRRRGPTDCGRVNPTLVDESDSAQTLSSHRGAHQAGVVVPETPPPSYEFTTLDSFAVPPPSYSVAIQGASGANSQSQRTMLQ